MDEIRKTTGQVDTRADTEVGAAAGAVAGNVGRPVQIRKPRADGWTTARRNAFLDHLAATCNVEQSVGVVGMSLAGVYSLRRRDAAFAEAWRAALDQGYQHIEGALLARAIGQQADPERHADPSAQPFDPETAFRLLAQRNRGERGPRRAGSVQVKHVPIEQVTASLKRKLDALAKRRGGE